MAAPPLLSLSQRLLFLSLSLPKPQLAPNPSSFSPTRAASTAPPPPEGAGPAAPSRGDRFLGTQLADPQVQAIRKLAKGVGLRMNIDERVAASLDVEADGQGDAEDLTAALKSAVTIGRQLARKNGMKKTAWLLDQARFHDAGDEGFALDVAVPGPFILRALGCDEDGNAVTESPGAVTPTVSPKSE